MRTNTGKSRIAPVTESLKAVFSSACADGLIAMKIVGYTDCKTTANIYPHIRDVRLRKATVNLEEVFGSRGK